MNNVANNKLSKSPVNPIWSQSTALELSKIIIENIAILLETK